MAQFLITIDDSLLAQVNTAIKASHSRLAQDQQLDVLPDFGIAEIQAQIMSLCNAFIGQDLAQQKELAQASDIRKLQESTASLVKVEVSSATSAINQTSV